MFISSPIHLFLFLPQNSDDEDRLSTLTDDILLSIHPGESRHSYGCDDKCLINTLDLKHLPWLLPELSIDVIGFLPVPYPNPIEVEHKDQAMASPTKAITSFLSTPWSETCHQKAAAQALFGQQLLRCHWTYCYSSS
jgi:hypothetical protein